MERKTEQAGLLSAFMQLTPQNQEHILAIMQALAFAQEHAMNQTNKSE